MIKCWYCNNELTTGDSPKHFGICNKCYDEMFKSSDTIISSFTNKISDLEAKLAEKDKTITTLVEDSKTSKELLKKQLSEKDKEIAYMTKQAKKFNNEAQKYYEDAYCNDFQKQTKIDFAVEQLKKVKKDIDCYMAIREGDLPSNIECLLLDFADKIDNQIKELKGEK